MGPNPFAEPYDHIVNPSLGDLGAIDSLPALDPLGAWTPCHSTSCEFREFRTDANTRLHDCVGADLPGRS